MKMHISYKSTENMQHGALRCFNSADLRTITEITYFISASVVFSILALCGGEDQEAGEGVAGAALACHDVVILSHVQ